MKHRFESRRLSGAETGGKRVTTTLRMHWQRCWPERVPGNVTKWFPRGNTLVNKIRWLRDSRCLEDDVGCVSLLFELITNKYWLNILEFDGEFFCLWFVCYGFCWGWQTCVFGKYKWRIRYERYLLKLRKYKSLLFSQIFRITRILKRYQYLNALENQLW